LKRVVIVCFTFPPFPGIGGRRWAKFARCLHEKGHDIQVIAAKKAKESESTWYKDTADYIDRVHFLPSKYPEILTVVPASLLQRFQYRLALVFVKIKNWRGNYFDPSSFYGPVVSAKVKDFIEKGYNNVIISCGPFRMTGDLLQLKDQYPEVNFILDFRDPWANNKTSFGFQSIGKIRLNNEVLLEKEVISKADVVLSVSQEMNDYFYEVHGKSLDSMVYIPNGLDRADFANLDRELNTRKNKLWVFTGTLYHKSERVFSRFCDALFTIQETGRWPDGLRLEFCGTVPPWFYIHTQKLGDKVQYIGNLGLNETYKKLAESSACMLFLTDDLAYSKSTKFFEYVAMKKPVLVMSLGGGAGNYVAEKNLGYNCTEQEMLGEVTRAMREIEQGEYHFPESYDVNAHDVMQITDSIVERLLD
jgi:glycosyltransferase involved in cell wall biosynthesis